MQQAQNRLITQIAQRTSQVPSVVQRLTDPLGEFHKRDVREQGLAIEMVCRELQSSREFLPQVKVLAQKLLGVRYHDSFEALKSCAVVARGLRAHQDEDWEAATLYQMLRVRVWLNLKWLNWSPTLGRGLLFLAGSGAIYGVYAHLVNCVDTFSP